MKDHDENTKSLYLNYLDVNNLYVWPTKLHVNDFKWVESTSQFNKDFIENQNNDSDEKYFLEIDVKYSENIT